MSDWNQAERDALNPKQFAGPGDTYPIKTQRDVDNAARLIGHAANPDEVKAKIISIAKHLGLRLPESWQLDAAKAAFSSMYDELNPTLLKAVTNGHKGQWAVITPEGGAGIGAYVCEHGVVVKSPRPILGANIGHFLGVADIAYCDAMPEGAAEQPEYTEHRSMKFSAVGGFAAAYSIPGGEDEDNHPSMITLEQAHSGIAKLRGEQKANGKVTVEHISGELEPKAHGSAPDVGQDNGTWGGAKATGKSAGADEQADVEKNVDGNEPVECENCRNGGPCLCGPCTTENDEPCVCANLGPKIVDRTPDKPVLDPSTQKPPGNDAAQPMSARKSADGDEGEPIAAEEPKAASIDDLVELIMKALV